MSRRASAAPNATGRVDKMPLTWKRERLHMGWCLDCHRNPAPHLRPREQVFDPHWRRTADTAARRSADGALPHPTGTPATDCTDMPSMSGR